MKESKLVVISQEMVMPTIVRWRMLARDARERITGSDANSDWYACKIRDGRYLRFRNDGKVEIRDIDYYTVLSVIDAFEVE